MYFLTLNTIFRGPYTARLLDRIDLITSVSGSSTWAGATAALTANLVLIAYVIVAMREDQSDRIVAEERAKKRR